MPTRAAGTRKNLLLTLWLLLPFAVLAGIVAIIFASYGKQKMDARPVGQGAGETGGANALGELLAGNDPRERERTARDLREGRLVDPLDWPHGVRFVFDPDPEGPSVRVLILWPGAGEPVNTLACGATERCAVTIPASEIASAFAEGRPGAGLYLAPSEAVSFEGGRVFDATGPLPRITIEPVAADRAIEGEPIEVVLPPSAGRD